MTKLGVFYHGCHHYDHYVKDLTEIAQLFDWVALPMTEWDMQYSPENIVRQVDTASRAGLSTWLLPWGMGGVFGGEGRWERLLCPLGREFRLMLEQWLLVAVRAQPDFLYWDEPTNKCCGNPFVDKLIEAARIRKIRSAVYLKESDLMTTNFDRASIVGSDVYDAITNGEAKATITSVKNRAKVLEAQSLLWLQGFRVNRKDHVELVLESLRQANGQVDYLGVWGYKNSEAMSALECHVDLWTPLTRLILSLL